MKGNDYMARGLEQDLRSCIEAYITAEIKDDELSVSVIHNGNGWRFFLDGLDEKLQAGLTRTRLFEFVFEKYLAYCLEGTTLLS